MTVSAQPFLLLVIQMPIFCALGVYHAIAGRKRKTPGEYLLASRRMNAFPVAVSLLISYISAVTLIGKVLGFGQECNDCYHMVMVMDVMMMMEIIMMMDVMMKIMIMKILIKMMIW